METYAVHPSRQPGRFAVGMIRQGPSGSRRPATGNTMSDLTTIVANARAEFDGCADAVALENAKAKYLGKSGTLTDLLKGLGKLSAAERPAAGAAINEAKQELEAALAARRAALADAKLATQLAADALDVSLPGRGRSTGTTHPLSRVLERVETLFHSLGFEVADGPEIEDDFHNFTALNTPENHPARSMQDTFYVEGGMVLRTHTSPMQVRWMETHPPPIAIIVPGRVYRRGQRRDAHAAVPPDRGPADRRGHHARRPQGHAARVRAGDLRRDERDVRLRPHFFPFTEPSVEVDVSCFQCGGTVEPPADPRCNLCKGTGWLEILGSGMVDPNVLRPRAEDGYDPEQSRASRSGMGSVASRCSARRQPTCASSTTTTCGSCASSPDRHSGMSGSACNTVVPANAGTTRPKCVAADDTTEAEPTMKFSEHWLRTMCNPPLSSAELADRLTMSGLEVEEAAPAAPPFANVVVARIDAVAAHPNADRLRVCTVDVGGPVALSIVCGAPNAAAGMLAPCALEGAVLPGGLAIKRATVRGVESRGMLCSAKELGIDEDASGLMALDPALVPGTPVRDALALDDTLITLKITPNRADCLSIAGIARDVAAVTGAAFVPLAVTATPVAFDGVRPVRVDEPEACPRFAARLIDGIDPRAPTPAWMKQRLERSGLRSISAVVDITNYVMLEMGQPLHNAHTTTGCSTARSSCGSRTTARSSRCSTGRCSTWRPTS